MLKSVQATARKAVQVLFLVDPDDPTLPSYSGLPVTVLPEPMGYTRALNHAAEQLWDTVPILGAFGDDVIFSSPRWDDEVRRTLATPGIAYGDDLIHGKNHPSAVFMSSVIAKALGWLALPATTHQWADDAWKSLGQQAGCLRFMERVIVEHEHPAVGKADWDDTYKAVFNDQRAASDYAGFMGWVESGGLEADADKVRAVL